MTQFDAPHLVKLEDSKLWLETSELADYMYSKLADFPEDEKWTSESKLRNAANDLMFSVAEALGDSSPAATEYPWSYVRKHATALKAIYRFSGRQKFIELDPQIMVRINDLLKLIDEEVMSAYRRTNDRRQAEVEHWRKTARRQNEDGS